MLAFIITRSQLFQMFMQVLVLTEFHHNIDTVFVRDEGVKVPDDVGRVET